MSENVARICIILSRGSANLSDRKIFMSKGNMLLGQARGKMGSIVFFVRDGIQQQRPHNPEPKNPRTISQMFQRVKLAAVVGFYKRQAAFFRFALKKKAKESYYNAFVRYNLNISPYFTKEQAASGISCPAPYIIADGNMPRINVAAAVIDDTAALEMTTSIPASITTWGDMRRAYDLVMGDMLSLVVFNAPDDELDPTKRIVVQHRFDAESDTMPIGYDMVGTEWTTDGERIQVNVLASYFGLTEFFATGSAIVLSRNNGQVDCSFAQLELDPVAQHYYDEMRTDAQRELAALSYGQESGAILDPKNFEGNYVDMATLYSSTDHQTVITELTMAKGDSDTAYFDINKFPRVSVVNYRIIAGVRNITNVDITDDNGEITVHSSETVSGTSQVLLYLNDEDGNLIASASVKVVVTP